MENGIAVYETEAPTYEEAFPPLGSPTHTATEVLFGQSGGGGGGGGGGGSYSKSHSAWPVKSIPSSTITQVRGNFLHTKLAPQM